MRKRNNSDSAYNSYYEELEKRKIEGRLPVELRDRFQIAEGRGIIGWEKKKSDTVFLIWDYIPKSTTITKADNLAIELGSETAFFDLYEVSFGASGGWFLTWILEKTVEWVAGEGLRLLIKKLKEGKVIKLTKELIKQPEFKKQNGKVYIRILPDGEEIFEETIVEIVGYPKIIMEIEDDKIEDLIQKIRGKKTKNYIYSKKGFFIETEDL